MEHDFPKNLLSLNKETLEKLVVNLGYKPFHGRQVFSWIHRKNVTEINQMTDLSKDLRKLLVDNNYSIDVPEVLHESRGESEISAVKYLLGLSDGTRVEIVLIPSEDRNTLCLSSQVGCAYSCKFCATGKLGLTRNMTAEEIVGSYIVACQNSENRISNVVFMGMGEPLANMKEVVKAWEILTDPDGIGLSRRKVTISTVGIPSQVKKLAEESYPPKLVFSITSPYDAVRQKYLPKAGKFSLKENHDALMYYSQATRNRITIALLVAEGLNDSIEDARALHKWIGNLPVKINLLRYNETDGAFKRTSEIKMEKVAAELVRLGRTVILRTSRGRDINAACGQLVAQASQTE